MFSGAAIVTIGTKNKSHTLLKQSVNNSIVHWINN